jgi:hypothetical protein
LEDKDDESESEDESKDNDNELPILIEVTNRDGWAFVKEGSRRKKTSIKPVPYKP